MTTTLWCAIIETPDYEQVISVELPCELSEEDVRDYLSKYYTVYEIWEEPKED